MTGWSTWAAARRRLDLVRALVRADTIARFKQTVLGPLWFALQPIGVALLFTLLFAKLMHIPHLGASPVGFYWAGMTLWSYFAASLTSVTLCFLTYAPILRKIYVPRFSLALSVATAKLFPFLIQLAALFVFLFGTRELGLVDLPRAFSAAILAAALALTTALGLGLVLAGISVQYRDLQHALGFLVQLWMYASPVIYPLELFPSAWRRWFFLNPLTGTLELFRAGVLRRPLDWSGISMSAAVAGLCLVAGVATLRLVEEKLADSL